MRKNELEHPRSGYTHRNNALVVEADGVEDRLHAFADVVEFAFSDVLDAADIAAAEVVDDGIEAIAGIVVWGGVDFVAGFGADAAVLVVAVGEGDSGDLGRGDGAGGAGDGLRGALVRGGVGCDAEVEERSAEGGVGVRVEADGGDRAHLSGMSRVAGVEAEGADVTVTAVDVPGGRDGEGDAVAGVVKGAGGGSGWLGGWRLASKKGRDGLGLAGNGFGRTLGVRGRQCGESCQQGEGGAGQNSGDSPRENCGESHRCLLLALLAAHARVGYSVGDIGEEIHSHIS